MNNDQGDAMTEPIIETSSAEETIAALLGEVARHSPTRALRILLEHLGMEEVQAAMQAEREVETEAPTSDEVAAANARADAFREFAAYTRGLLAGLEQPLSGKLAGDALNGALQD